jgi:DNA topoisomerase-1
VLGDHPDDKASVEICSGRYGPYARHGKINATLPKGVSPDDITLEEALELIAAKAAKGGVKGKKPAAKVTKEKTTKAKAAPKETKAKTAKPKAITTKAKTVTKKTTVEKVKKPVTRKAVTRKPAGGKTKS